MIKNKELLNKFENLLKETWRDEKMIEYCKKEADELIILKDGSMICIDKPRIETRFCFGHGYCGISSIEDEKSANDLAHYAATNQNYFIRENLEGIENKLAYLKVAKEDFINKYGNIKVYTRQNYSHGNSELRDYEIVKPELYPEYAPYRWGNEKPRQLDDEDIQRLIDGYENVKARFIKRLNTYLKRYGMNKVKTWSYLRD